MTVYVNGKEWKYIVDISIIGKNVVMIDEYDAIIRETVFESDVVSILK